MIVSSKTLNHQIYPKYSFKFKLLITLCHCLLYVIYGVLDSLPTVVLTDIAYLMRMDMVTAARGLTAKGISYSIGAVICEYQLDPIKTLSI